MPEVWTAIGNVGGEPEMQYTPKGAVHTKFSLATNAGKDKEGNKVTTWVRVTTWNDLAEKVNEILKKGERVQVSGYLLPPRMYERGDGTNGVSLEMTAFHVGIVPRNIRFVDLGEKADNGEAAEDSQDPDPDDDDLPF